MKLVVLGGCGAWPGAGQACSGYLVAHEGFRLLIDPGYATLPLLLGRTDAELVDAVLISHSHADHCADLHPLLRARHFRDDPPPALPVFALAGALGPVLALDRPGLLDDAYALHDLTPGQPFAIGPFDIDTWALPHSVPNLGIRLRVDGASLAYTGDTGPSPDLLPLARAADVFLAEASYPEHVPADSERTLSSAAQAAETAARAGVGRLVLTHLLPGTDPQIPAAVARRVFDGDVSIARPGLVLDTVR
jgi:ribonuclease BN (tRNA processing enzyme)